MPDQYDYDLIRDYLHGLVDRESAKQISALIASDETARSIAEGILILEKNFSTEEEVDRYLENFRLKQLAVIDNLTAPRSSGLWMKIAASVLLIACVGFAVQLSLEKDAMAIVEEELSEPYPVSNVVRGSSGSAPLETALDLYNQKKYGEALPFFRQAAGNPVDPATTKFYHGLAHLYTGQYSEAVGLLEDDVIAASRYAQQARWASALAALKLNNKDKARLILTSISQDAAHYKHKNAIELLDSLD